MYGKLRGSLFGNYLEAANYADYAFGVFVNRLKEEELYDDSVIIVYGDHSGLGLDEELLDEFVKEVTPNYNDLKKRHTYLNLLCGIKVPNIENMQITKTVSKLDIKPTLLRLSGIEDDISLGDSFFSTKDYAYINNGEIVTNDYYYYGNEWYEWETGEKVSSLEEDKAKKLAELVENMNLELNISRSIIINNLLKS